MDLVPEGQAEAFKPMLAPAPPGPISVPLPSILLAGHGSSPVAARLLPAEALAWERPPSPAAGGRARAGPQPLALRGPQPAGGRRAASPQQPCDGARAETPEEALVSSVLSGVLGDDIWESKPTSKSPTASKNRWWTQSQRPLLCTLTGFPISMLPYPPFKFRVDPQKPNPYRLVDGKYLAMMMVSGSPVPPCTRELQESDVGALDGYIQRCKLGPFRPGRVLELMKDAAVAGSLEDKKRVMQELDRFRAAARAELGKLHRIQENRLMQLRQQQQQPGKPQLPQQRRLQQQEAVARRRSAGRAGGH